MAFGNIDHIENHVTGERKQVVSIDLDKEYGIKGYGNFKDTKEEIEARKKWLLDNRLARIESILCMPVPVKAVKAPYDAFLLLDEKNKKYIWNEESIKSLHDSMLSNLDLIAHKRIDSNYEFYYIDCNGYCTDYKGEPYSPLNPNFNL